MERRAERRGRKGSLHFLRGDGTAFPRSLATLRTETRHDLAAYRGRNTSSRPRRRRLENACTYALRLAARGAETGKVAPRKARDARRKYSVAREEIPRIPGKIRSVSQLRTSRVSLFLLLLFLLLSPPFFSPSVKLLRVLYPSSRRPLFSSPSFGSSCLSFDSTSATESRGE